MNRSHTCGELRKVDAGKTVKLCGWVSKRRNLGSLVFIDLRDRYGITQITFDESKAELVKDVRNEYVLEVEGKVQVKESPNNKLETGEIEVIVDNVKILSSAKTTPMIIADETDALEETRLKYRYLDIRRNPIKNNLILRDKVISLIRNELHLKDFIEVETPILSKSTPEGARDYLVPSRLYHGSFYALPQSPQIYKQLLMIGGIDKYFQIARCFRDEDLRADRQPEFTQLDIEMSFADEEDIFKVVEDVMSKIFKEVKGIDNLKFERIKYDDALNYYGSDKPDLRFDNKLVNISDLFKNTEFKVFKDVLDNEGIIKGILFKNTSLSRKQLDGYQEFVRKYNAKALAYLKLENDTFSGSINNAITEKEKESIKELVNMENGDIFLIIGDEEGIVNQALGALRVKLGNDLDLINKDEYKFVWIVDFPMYEYSKEENRYVAAHHPFTSPKQEDIDKLLTDKKNCYSRAYDLVLNGYELLSGSIRIHDKDLQAKVFEALELSEEEAKAKFGFFLEAFEYGTPPHCGIGLGIERLIMILSGTDNIKDVVAFPKTSSAMCLMSESPSEVSDKQLKDLGIKKA